MTTKLLKFVLLFKALLFVCYLSFSQSIHLNFNDGSNLVYQIEDIQKITFENESLNLHLFDGSVYSWDINSITSNSFELPLMNVENFLSDINNWNIVIYPNPTSEEIYIHCKSKIQEEVTIKIFDQQGVLKSENNFKSNDLDESMFKVDISFLPTGIYVCSIAASNHSVRKLIHKH